MGLLDRFSPFASRTPGARGTAGIRELYRKPHCPPNGSRNRDILSPDAAQTAAVEFAAGSNRAGAGGCRSRTGAGGRVVDAAPHDGHRAAAGNVRELLLL